jgi:hypothetical protein
MPTKITSSPSAPAPSHHIHVPGQLLKYVTQGLGRAAACYTLIGICDRAGIDAQAWLADLFTRLANPAQTTKSLHRLTPEGWAADRKSAAPTPAS